MNATRFALKPIPQPQYRFSNVPAAQRDLHGSTVQCVTDREAWQACMGEMLLVCKEAIRRRRKSVMTLFPPQPAATATATATATNGEAVKEKKDDRKPAATSAAAASAHAHAHAHASTHAHAHAAHGSKPLSLEYIADRLDVDDPMWGFVVRTNDCDGNGNGMLQGFITVTTFTNYNRTFRWDSLHSCSFQLDGDGEEDGSDHCDHNKHDDDNDIYDMANRKVDTDGSLAREMNATVRAGDIWNEGIVWPRIAEIGLLGGLACGRTLVKLVIEQLECMRPSARANYDYVVLQATDNSIPFYESLGFCRVGAVMQQENIASSDDQDDNDASYSCSSSSTSTSTSTINSDLDSEDNANEAVVAQPLSSSDDSQQQPVTALTTPCALVSSKTMQYTTTWPGETPTQVAKKLNVNVYDIIFLNQSLYPEIAPSSKTHVGTILLIPDEPVVAPPEPPQAASLTANDEDDPKLQAQPQQPIWYIAKENETPRSISRKLGLNCIDLVNANKQRLQGLLSSSRLKDGTRVKVSQFDSDTELYKPYAHWTFPDDKFEEGEPSYMMALKLNRSSNSKKGYNVPRPFATSLAVPVVGYQPNSNKLLLLAVADNDQTPAAASAAVAAAAAPPTTKTARTGRRRWQSHQDAESNSSSCSSTDDSNNTSSTVTNEDDDDDDVIQEKMPKPPLKPAFVYPYRLFCADFKRDNVDLLHKMHASEAMHIMGDAWRKLPPREKQAYDQRIARFKHEYETNMQVFRETVARIRRVKELRRVKKLGLLPVAAAPAVPLPLPPPPPPIQHHHPSINLFNKVVKLKPGSSRVTEGSLHLYEYWYVLTYIPDLQWCHLAPLYKIGRVFGDNNDNNKPNSSSSGSSAGRPIWKLVDEELGEEVDISSSLVIPVKAKSMKRTLDADKEEWDVIGTPLPLTAPALSRSTSLVSGFCSSQVAVSRIGSFCDSTCGGSSVAATTTSTATAGTSRKRKWGRIGSDGATQAAAAASSSKQLPGFAVAVMPRTAKRVKVWIKISPGRGRPRGSKNKKPDRLVPNHVVMTGKKKPPPSSYSTDYSSKNNNKGDDNKSGRSSNLHSTRNNSRVKVVLPPTDVMASLEHASTPLKMKQPPQTNSKKPAAANAGRRPVDESHHSHSAALPTACRTTRNSMTPLAFSPLKQSTKLSAKGRLVMESQNNCHLAAVPSASRTTRNSVTTLLPADETVGTLAAKPASSALKQSAQSSGKAIRSVVGSQNVHPAAMPSVSRTTRNRVASSFAGATAGTLVAQPASSQVRQSPRALVISRPVAESHNSHAAAMPASRTTRNSRASLSGDKTGGALAVKPASSPGKQSTWSSTKDRAVVVAQNGHFAAAMPATSRTTRNGMASLSVDQMGGSLAAINQSDHVHDSQVASVPPPESFPVGSVVLVQARSWPGYNKRWYNKPGGVAHVTRVQQQGESMRYDVKYVLGGREKDIEAVFLSWHDKSTNTRPVSNREAAVADRQPSSTIKQPDSQISSQESPPLDDPQVDDSPSLSSSLPLVNGPESKVSASFPVGAAVVVQGRWCPGSKHRPGGVARVTRVRQGDSILYDVKYVLGGNEKSVEESLLSWHSDNVVRPVRSNEAVTGKRVSASEAQQQESQTVTASQKSSQPGDGKSSSSLVKHPRHQAAHSDEDAIASGGENNSQTERTSSRRQPKRISALALLDDGTRGRGTPRNKSVRTRSMDILTEVAPYPNKRRRVDGSYLPSQTSTRRARDPLDLFMP